jgi:REP element-mobilizing transposase RayT
MKNELKGWHSRGYLPHFDGGEIPQFITFRLFDSLPQVVLTKWKAELEREKSVEAETILRRRIETYLDQSFGKCYLKHEQVADLVQNALLFFDGERYKLLAWVIMPNHIHFLVTPIEKQSLPGIVQSLKIFTAKEANKLLNRQGGFWQPDYFDRYIAIGSISPKSFATSKTILSKHVFTKARTNGVLAAHISSKQTAKARADANLRAKRNSKPLGV